MHIPLPAEQRRNPGHCGFQPRGFPPFYTQAENQNAKARPPGYSQYPRAGRGVLFIFKKRPEFKPGLGSLPNVVRYGLNQG
jgi:hypothetical protein